MLVNKRITIDQHHRKPASHTMFVKSSCIGCNLCVVLAPDHFRENLDLETKVDSVYILRQPESEAELDACREAMQLCPVNAIKGVPL